MKFARATSLLIFVFAVARLEAADWQTLLGGDDMSGWTAVSGPQQAWSVQKGILRCNGMGRGWLASPREYDNFELELEVRIQPGGNSGIFLRTPTGGGDPTYHGMEVQILDNDAPKHANLKDFQYAGSLYAVVGANPRPNCTPGSWHKFNVLCDKRKVRVTLDGHVVVDVNLDDHRDLVGKVPGIARKTGHIGLQNYGNKLEFQHIRIRTL